MLASEYGWSKEYILYDLPYHEVLELMNAISNRRKREKNNDMANQLFSTYQVRETLIAVNSSKKYKGKTFKNYLRELGLSDLLRSNSGFKKSDYQNTIKKAKQNAEDAISSFGKGGE